MTSGSAGRFGLIGAMFEPPVDFYELLCRQSAKTLEGMETLYEWIAQSDESLAQKVRDREHEADELKLDLSRKLVDTFVTPFDREDIYDLSARMDEIINAAKSVVREVEALAVPTDNPFLREMAEVLREGTRCLNLSFRALKSDLNEAADQALLSRKSENRFAKLYRLSMRQLFTLDDLKLILRTKEVYRQMLVAAEKLDAVGEKLLHVIVKIG